MNIFDIYLDKIIKLIENENKNGLLKLPEKLNSINVDIPPRQFDCDISTNVSMVLAKINSKQPLDIAKKISELIEKDDQNIDLHCDYVDASNWLSPLLFQGFSKEGVLPNKKARDLLAVSRPTLYKYIKEV